MSAWWQARRKQVRINAVVNHLSGNGRFPISEQARHFFADANHFACASINAGGSVAAPFCNGPLLEAAVKNIQAANGNHKRNAQTMREKRRSVAARQRSVRMDHINPRAPMKLAHAAQENRAQEIPRTRQTKITGKAGIANPLRRELIG